MKVIVASLFLPSSIVYQDSKKPDVPLSPSSPLYLNPLKPTLLQTAQKQKSAAVLPKNINPEEISFTPMKSGNIGLVNALNSVDLLKLPRVWIGSLDTVVPEELHSSLKSKLQGMAQVPVFLTEEEVDGHYNQFCKQILWKTFHYQFPADARSCTYERLAWKQYEFVNNKFALAIAEAYEPGDIGKMFGWNSPFVVWINDYHLMLVPAMVRKLLPNAAIGFFLHIPFPSSEIFRCLYVRNQILLGILGADLIGFQTYSFLRHFLMNCTRLLSLETTPKGIQLDNTLVSCGIFPIGINLIALNKKRSDPQVPEMIASLKEKYANKKLIIGRDKNDYVKGVRLKMLAFERFLYCHPEWIGKVVLIQVALSTTEANENECMVSDVVARINSKFGSIEYHPVVYLHQDISFSHYLALLTIADACLITSLRDGMNLTSHEYVVCQESKHAPLIMSEFAGTYGSFGCALRVNPWDKQEVADAIHEALTMSEEERYNRWKELYRNVKSNTAQNYVEHFTKEIQNAHDDHFQSKSSQIPLLHMQDVYVDYMACHKRLLILDDEGTLFNQRPGELESVHELLNELCQDSRNLVYLMSGKTKKDLEVFKDIPGLGISAENGSFLKFTDRHVWIPISQNVDLSWKKAILDILEFYMDRTPGSFIEQKEMGLVWHIGFADYNFGKWQAAECMNHIQNCGYYSIHTLAKKKSVEVMPKNIHKGMAIRRIIEHHQGRRLSAHFMQACSSSFRKSPQVSDRDSPELVTMGSPESFYMTSPQSRSLSPSHHGRKTLIDFILCIGDDRQDEYMFEYLLREDSSNLYNETSDPPSPVFLEESDILQEQHRMMRPLRSTWTCTIGEKSSAAKWHLPGVSDVLNLLILLTKSSEI